MEKTIEQVAIEAVLKYGIGTPLDINRKYAQICGLSYADWLDAPIYIRAIAIVGLGMFKDKKGSFKCHPHDLENIHEWLTKGGSTKGNDLFNK